MNGNGDLNEDTHCVTSFVKAPDINATGQLSDMPNHPSEQATWDRVFIRFVFITALFLYTLLADDLRTDKLPRWRCNSTSEI
jgi:hypothetical protein